MKKIVAKLRNRIQYLRREIHREKRNFFIRIDIMKENVYSVLKTQKMDKLRDELSYRRKRKLKRDEDLTKSGKKRNKRFYRKHKKNSSCLERRKDRKYLW